MSTPGRRHYRVAQKEVEACSNDCCKDINKLIAVGVVALVAAAVQGLIIGYLIGRNKNN